MLRVKWLIVHVNNSFVAIVSVRTYQNVGHRVSQENAAVCAPVQQGWRVFQQPPVRVPLTVWREHPTEEAGLLKTGGLPEKYSLGGSVGASKWRGGVFYL